MNLANDLVHDFERDAKLTEKLIAAVPDDQLDYQPHEKSMTLAQLVGHIVEMPTWMGAILEDEMDFENMGDYQPFVPGSRAEAVAAFAENKGLMRSGLEDRDEAFLQAPWRMRKGDQVLMEQPRHEVIRDVLIHHAAHHRGQLTVYLRLLGASVPATFGSTADEQVF